MKQISSTEGVTVPRDDESREVTDVERNGDALDRFVDSLGTLFGAEGTPPRARRVATEMPAVRPDGEDTAIALPIENTRERRKASAPLLPDGPRYEVGEEIGRGGMGEVVAAHDIQIGRDVAIKRLHADKPSPAAQARFLREARIQGRLEHPAIPPVYDLAHDDEGRPYFAMRKLEGVTLADTLRAPRSPFTRQRLLRAFIDICNAMELAHSRRIIHRDLKPSNILLGEHGEVYVLDWGIARELDSTEAFGGAVVGTPGYMAPEQLRAEADLDPRVDVYALGCILFEIVTRRPLHAKGDAGVEQALRGEFPYDAEMPLELQTACRRATCAQRSNRIASARQLGDLVQAFLDGDRDLEQRRTLARHHLASARIAFTEISDDEARRSIVMREAGKALALDPTIDGAAELIGRIVLEPPTRMPTAVRDELAQMDQRASRAMAQLSIGTSALHCVVFLIFVLFGMSDALYLTLFGTGSFLMLAISTFGVSFHSMKIHRPLSLIWVSILIAMVGLVSRMFTPVLVAPTLAILAVSTMPFNPVATRRHAIVATIAALLATLGVWAAELVGILSPTVSWANGTMALSSPVEGVANVPVFPILFAITGINIVMAAGIGFVARRSAERSRDKLVLQAWHLRQLV
jgi:eukaryotic-like serine/threonine-protein kinase